LHKLNRFKTAHLHKPTLEEAKKAFEGKGVDINEVISNNAK